MAESVPTSLPQPSRRELEMDEEANLFARCLLMPEHLVRGEVKRLLAGRDRVPDLMDDRDTFIRDLAAVFMVPQAAMTLRLMELEMISL